MSADAPRDMAAWIMAAAKVALIGSTPAPLRQYSFRLDESAKRITLKAEVDRPLTEDEWDDLNVAEGELWAEGFFDDEEMLETVIEVVPPPLPLNPLPDIVYTRDDDQTARAALKPGPRPPPPRAGGGRSGG